MQITLDQPDQDPLSVQAPIAVLLSLAKGCSGHSQQNTFVDLFHRASDKHVAQRLNPQ